MSSEKRSSQAASLERDSKKCKSNDTNINHFSGWTVPSANYELPSIDVNNITPRQFYDNYVKPRRPVVIKGIPSDLSGLQSWNDIQHLNKKAGSQSVMIERRSTTTDGYGQGNEVSMKFSQFIELIQNGDDLHYLTTQDVRSNDDGRPDILPKFMKALSEDFPIQPLLMGNLIPQNINLWMGNNKDYESGSSSGLHHDYHDNLYIVLKGKKRFRLFSPADTQYLYTRGTLLQVHPNGRINYVGEETTAYGADLGADAAARAATRQKLAEERLHLAEMAVEEGRGGAEEELAAAEEEMEEAMDALIDAEDEDDVDGNVGCERFCGNASKLVDKTVKNPNNFSKISVQQLDDLSKATSEFPELKKATMAYCSVHAGDMLYLPASWFHEVTSYGVEGASCHLALNYWFHPPDGNTFDAPYSTDFWPNDFKDRIK